jgi:hypothetical protein
LDRLFCFEKNKKNDRNLKIKSFEMAMCYVFKLLGKLSKKNFDIFCKMAPFFGKMTPDFACDLR